MSDNAAYPIPDGPLGLTGPVKKPAPGTLPLRGDVAHIALANRYLVPHYVVPNIVTLPAATPVFLTQDDRSEVLLTLETGDSFEVLDFTSEWAWGACGPDGPSGYVKRSALDI